MTVNLLVLAGGFLMILGMAVMIGAQKLVNWQASVVSRYPRWLQRARRTIIGFDIVQKPKGIVWMQFLVGVIAFLAGCFIMYTALAYPDSGLKQKLW